MKKVLAFCLALVLVLSMAACNTKPTEDDTTTPAPTTQAPTQKPDDQPTDKPDQPTEPPVEEPRLPLVKDGSVTLTIGIPQNAFVEDYDTKLSDQVPGREDGRQSGICILFDGL